MVRFFLLGEPEQCSCGMKVYAFMADIRPAFHEE